MPSETRNLVPVAATPDAACTPRTRARLPEPRLSEHPCAAPHAPTLQDTLSRSGYILHFPRLWQTGLPDRARRGGGPYADRLWECGGGWLDTEILTVTEQEIEAKVIEIVANQMGADKAQITRNTSFVEDLNADSLDTVELVMEFEDEFETSIPDEQAEKIKTVGQAIDFIKQAVGNG